MQCSDCGRSEQFLLSFGPCGLARLAGGAGACGGRRTGADVERAVGELERERGAGRGGRAILDQVSITVGYQHVAAFERRLRVERAAQAVQRIDLASRMVDALKQGFRSQSARGKAFALAIDPGGKQGRAQGAGMARELRGGDFGAVEKRAAKAVAEIIDALGLALQERVGLGQALAARFEAFPCLAELTAESAALDRKSVV